MVPNRMMKELTVGQESTKAWCVRCNGKKKKKKT